MKTYPFPPTKEDIVEQAQLAANESGKTYYVFPTLIPMQKDDSYEDYDPTGTYISFPGTSVWAFSDSVGPGVDQDHLQVIEPESVKS